MSERHELDLDALEALLGEATPGPWDAVRRPDEGSAWVELRSRFTVAHGVDADLIAVLRNAAPALIERAREADRLEAVVEKIARDIQAAKPPHMTRVYTAVDQAYDRAAQIARAALAGPEATGGEQQADEPVDLLGALGRSIDRARDRRRATGGESS